MKEPEAFAFSPLSTRMAVLIPTREDFPQGLQSEVLKASEKTPATTGISKIIDSQLSDSSIEINRSLPALLGQ